jgi:hypothetical protein
MALGGIDVKRFKSTLLSFVFLLFLASSVVAQNGPALPDGAGGVELTASQTLLLETIDIKDFTGIKQISTAAQLAIGLPVNAIEYGEKIPLVVRRNTADGTTTIAQFKNNTTVIGSIDTTGVSFPSYTMTGNAVRGNSFRDPLNNLLIGYYGSVTVITPGKTESTSLELYPVGMGPTINGGPSIKLTANEATLFGPSAARPGENSVAKVIQVQLNAAAKVSLQSALGLGNFPAGKIRVINTTGGGMIDAYLDGTNTATSLAEVNGAVSDTASKICVYFDPNDYDFYLKNNLVGTRLFLLLNTQGETNHAQC